MSKNTVRILYLAHDTTAPSGGTKVIYDHVALLRASGFDAYVVHSRHGYRYPFYESEVPVLWQEDNLAFAPQDHLVVPENFPLAELNRLSGANIHIFVQSFMLLYKNAAPEIWKTLSSADIFCPSQYIADMLKRDLQITPSIIPNAVDPIFRPLEKSRTIAFMPRRMGPEAAFILNHAQMLSESMTTMQPVVIDGMELSQAATILGKAAIYLCTSYLEGFGLPALEAMASGCLVVGFHGFGGSEYARTENGLWLPEVDVLAAARKLVQAVDMYDSAPEKVRAMIASGRETAARYSKRQQAVALQEYWETRING